MSIKFVKRGTKRFDFKFKENNLYLKIELTKDRKCQVVNLYQEGKEDKFIKTMGYLTDDGYGCSLNGKSFIKGITDVENCKNKTESYLKSLLN